jgi:hypothetical protein
MLLLLGADSEYFRSAPKSGEYWRASRSGHFEGVMSRTMNGEREDDSRNVSQPGNIAFDSDTFGGLSAKHVS